VQIGFSFNNHKAVIILPFGNERVKAFAETVNVILKQVPPKMTWRCQPADVAWIKPMKDGLRRRWVEHLRRQLDSHKRRQQLLREQEALRRQEALERQEPPAPEQQAPRFEMTPPDRGDVVEWVTEEWFNLSERTIKSGFSKCGFTAPGHTDATDSTARADGGTEDEDVTELVTELQQVGFADTEIGEVAEGMDVLDPVLGVAV
jgi:hypothetical protein